MTCIADNIIPHEADRQSLYRYETGGCLHHRSGQESDGDLAAGLPAKPKPQLVVPALFEEESAKEAKNKLR